MNKNPYNGWTNYETWCANLWMDNEAGTQDYYRELAEQAWKAAKPTIAWSRYEAALFSLADSLKAEFEDSMPEDCGGFWTDLMHAALSEINWTELAGALLTDHEDASAE